MPISSARDYNLIIWGKDVGQAVLVRPGTPSAKGWIERYRDNLDEAVALELVPNRPGLPQVRVALGEGRKWVYYRQVQGVIVANALEPKRVLHCVGYREHVGGRDVKHIVRIDGETGIIELGEE
jgi:hypothetical protein